MERQPVKENDPIEFSGFLLILLKKKSTQRQKDIGEAKNQDELYKTLNPKYFENIISLEEAKLKVNSSDIIYSTKYNISSFY
ncbi:MAG: hypothetical protein ACXAC5_13705 [Promethearchaeota archaeon]|jgi:hypothetical protein